MFDSIRGVVTGIDMPYILLETGPVTVQLLTPGYFLNHVVIGEPALFFLLFQITNEGNRGIPLAVAFPSREDREFFRKFISVSGVGIKAAVRAMTLPPAELAAAIAAGDTKVLHSLPGIGKTRAKQIVAKLQDVMSKSDFASSLPPISGNAADARAVLEQLGIPSSEAVSLVNAAVDKIGAEASSSAIVRAAMKLRN